MCCVKYGVTADYVIGMTVVLATGAVLHLGGKTRKRPSGYRLMALFVGSEGTFGVVTEVVMKLVPQPRYRRTAMVGFSAVEDAAAAVSRVLSSGYSPAALELMDQSALQLVAEYLPPGFHPRLDAVLIVEQDGNDLDHVERELLALTGALGGVDNRVAQSETERERLWKARRQLGSVSTGDAAQLFR